MSCSLKSNLLCYSNNRRQSDPKNFMPEKRGVIPVFCACMIALQGAISGMNHDGLSQQEHDSVTEFIEITQKQFFSNYKSEITSRG